MTDEITNGELGRRLDAMVSQMAHGFASVNRHIDGLQTHLTMTDTRVSALEARTMVTEQKIINLERETFSPVKRPVTRGDVYLVVGAIAVVAAIVRWLPALVQIRGIP